MNVRKAAPVVCLLVSLSAAFAQQRVDPLNRYERLIAIVPMVGAGTDADLRRPQYAPPPSQMAAPSQSGAAAILGYTMVESDDGKFALVEFVAHDPAAFQSILADTSIKTFLKGRSKREDAEAEFKKLKKDFSIANFGLRMVQ